MIFILISLSAEVKSQILEENICAKGKIHQQKMMKRAAVKSTHTDFDFTYADIHWKVDPAERYIEGEITYEFTALQPADFLYLELDVSLTVDSVFSGQSQLDNLQEAPATVKINLGKELQPGERDTVTIFYQGVPTLNGFGSFALGKNDSGPTLWTLSEPYGARDWWPCYQNLSDKIDSVDIRIQVPEQFETGSNGTLESVTPTGDEKIYHWKHRYPIAIYLVAIAVADYEEVLDTVSLTAGKLPLQHLLYPETLKPAKAAIEDFPKFFQWLDSLLIPYPYMTEKYGHAEFGWGGGMEHQTMSFMGAFTFELMIHEAAHQWYGDLVTCGTWHDIWLNEGFATYLTAIAYERFDNQTFWSLVIPGMIKFVTEKPGGSVYVYDTTSVDRIFNGRLTYRKAAMVLHMLRWEMGDDVFFDAIRNYLLDPEFEFQFATTEQFKSKMESETGRSFEEFFKDWIYGEGYPSYSVKWQQKEGTLKLEIAQSTSHPSVDFFEMHVPIHIQTTKGDTVLRLWNARDRQKWEIPFSSEIVNVAFDPAPWIVSKNNTVLQVPSDLLRIGVNTNPNSVIVASLNPFIQLDQVEIFDLTGRKMVEINSPVATVFNLSTADWASGYYLVRMRAEGMEQTKRFHVLR